MWFAGGGASAPEPGGKERACDAGTPDEGLNAGNQVSTEGFTTNTMGVAQQGRACLGFTLRADPSRVDPSDVRFNFGPAAAATAPFFPR